MRKIYSFLAVLTLAIFFTGLNAYAGFELYDNFDSGVIDPTKWVVHDSSATITVEGGRAKFVHNPGFPNESSWLQFKQSPETIKAILAVVEVASCTGDVRARVAGWHGKIGADYVFNHLNVCPQMQRIDGGLSVIEGGTQNFLYNLYWAKFKEPITILGQPFMIATTFFNPNNVMYIALGLGNQNVQISQPIAPTDNHFKGIGTRSTNGDGPCTVYFDQVWVLR